MIKRDKKASREHRNDEGLGLEIETYSLLNRKIRSQSNSYFRNNSKKGESDGFLDLEKSLCVLPKDKIFLELSKFFEDFQFLNFSSKHSIRRV